MDFVKRYCDMIIEVAEECKDGKRTLEESIDLINNFTKNMESFTKKKAPDRLT